MKRFLSALVMVGALCAAGLPARADVDTARALLLKGEYKSALAEYQRSARGASRGEALLGQAVLHRRTGRYADAARLARQAMRTASVRGRALVIYAEALIDVGKVSQAIKVLEKAVRQDGKNFPARALLGLAYQDAGQRLKAGVIWKDLFRDWDNGVLDKKRGDHTFYVGLAGEGDKNWQFASDAYEQAVKLSPKLYAANIVWGNLFISKFNVPEAEKCFQDVLKYDPNHADAWAGMAWVEWNAARPNKAKGKKHAERALKTNPNHVEALLYLASLEIFDAAYGRALILVSRALKVNPNHLRALSHLATIHYMREKTAEYKKIEARVKRLNNEYSDFYWLIAKFANRHHLYKEAVALNKQAKALDPKNEKALAALGVALLRVGDEGEGLFWLKEAWKVDRFNHQTMNLLNLYDDMAKKYVTLSVGQFKFRMPKDEAKVLGRYVPKLMNRVLKGYIKKYRWRPPTPIIVELYDSQKDFTVRTFGEPSGGGILGVCFGPVITAMSPSLGRANWAMVLTHELSHTVHIAISRGRVARWFTEGLAEYETIIARPEWKREHRLDLYRAIKMKVIRGIDTLNLAFTHSKTPQGVVIAYFQSSQAIFFIAQKWGYKALNKALRLFGGNKTTAEVIPAITGLQTEAFDRQFHAWLLTRFKIYDRNFDPFAASVVPLADLEGRVKAAPKSARAHANLAVGYLMHRKPVQLEAALASALKLDPKDPVARYLAAGKALREGKPAEAKKILQALTRTHDGYLVRMALASLAQKDKDEKEALAQYAAAHHFDPERAAPLDARVRLLDKQKKQLQVVLELGKLAAIREGSASLLYSILVRADKIKRYDLVRRYGLQAVHSQPLNMAIHEKYAWALKAGRQYRRAVFEFESALATVPDAMPPEQRAKLKLQEAWIYLGIAECWAALRERDRALRAVVTALSRDSNLARAVQLRKKLDPTYRPGGE
ncbi:MAG: tetratricopeptide repeat protein [bacterium]